MTREEKSDKVFDIINNGKIILTGKYPSFNATNPFDFRISKDINNKNAVQFSNINEAIDIICENMNPEYETKLREQILNQAKSTNTNTTKEFILEFLML